MGEKRMDEQSSLVKLTLPWPPSVNHYWRRNGARYFVSPEGKRFREEVCNRAKSLTFLFGSDIKLMVSIEAYPPDRRRRDLDNILKSLLDALQHAGVYADDSQIDKLSVQRCTPLCNQVIVSINVYQGTSSS